MTTKKLFVYGTLRNFHPNSVRFGLSGSCPVTEGVRLEGYDLFNLGWFPGIKPGEGAVIGDVFDVPTGLFATLDQYEGVPNLYTRQTVSITDIGDPVEVYVYNGNPGRSDQIESGNWEDRQDVSAA